MAIAVRTLRLVHSGAKEKARAPHTREEKRVSVEAAGRKTASMSTSEPTSSTAPSTCPSAPEVARDPSGAASTVSGAGSARVGRAGEQPRQEGLLGVER